MEAASGAEEEGAAENKRVSKFSRTSCFGDLDEMIPASDGSLGRSCGLEGAHNAFPLFAFPCGYGDSRHRNLLCATTKSIP